ncbi:YbaN family protein [Candidatus Neomarinimicrobiota bacterium]
MTVEKSNRVLRPFLIMLGFLSVGLGAVGIFLPILPTTPFLLLAAACFIRSSEKLYQRLISNRWFGKYLKNYREGNGVPIITKVIGISALWITIGFSAMFATDILAIRIVLLLVAVGVTVHLVLLPTYHPKK